MTLAKQQLTAAHHSLDASARTIASGVALRHHAWLRTSSFPYDSRAFIEDLPFDGDRLFHSTTDNAIQELDKTIKATKNIRFSSHSRSSTPRSSSSSWTHLTSRLSATTWKPRRPCQPPWLSYSKPSFIPGQPSSKGKSNLLQKGAVEPIPASEERKGFYS